MEATSKNVKTEAWINGEWIEFHISSHVMFGDCTELEKDRYILLGYGHKIKVDGIILETKYRMKFFKCSK